MAIDTDTCFASWIDNLRAMQRYRKVFITGCPKSGTTWLVKSINGHPNIVADGEGRFAWRLFSFMEQALNAFNGDQKGVHGTSLALLSPEDAVMLFRAAGEQILKRYIDASGKPPDQIQIVADKTPQHIVVFPLLRTVFPDCRFLNIVRDPRDAATSALFHFAKTDPRPRNQFIEHFITEVWKTHVESAVRAEKELGPDSVLTVRYEDFHSNDLETLRKCLHLMSAETSDAILLACRQAGKFETLSGGRQRGQTDNNSFFRNGTVGDWRNHIDRALTTRCCAQVADLMERYGYEIDSPNVKVTVYAKSTIGQGAA